LKLKLADLISALAEAKIELTEVQETIAQKDKRIAELEEALQSSDSLVRRYDAYYHTDENGQPIGIPFCLRCWENDHKNASSFARRRIDFHVFAQPVAIDMKRAWLEKFIALKKKLKGSSEGHELHALRSYTGTENHRVALWRICSSC
jgi:hypothetical protein